MGLSKGFLNSTTPCLPFIMVIGPWQDAGPMGRQGVRSGQPKLSSHQTANVSTYLKRSRNRKQKQKQKPQQPPLPPHLHYISPLIQSNNCAQVTLKNLMNPNPKGLAQARTCGCGGCAKPVSKALYLSDAARGCHDELLFDTQKYSR